MNPNSSCAKKQVRCAIYTRKSTDEGLEREFNSLDAQREACESYIASQKHEGWICLTDAYDDGGYSGGTVERPALKRLLADLEAGQIDCVVVYKVDRLSRSLLDFARMVEIFERNNVAFVSVTQPIHSGNSTGRLMLNVLLSFAQFEREIISERTRDKMRAARRKGKRLGGTPVLGYTVDAETRRLVVHEAEASRVRAIFELYLMQAGLVATAEELARRRWVTKRWTTRKGRACGGKTFNKASLHYLLTNRTYTGYVSFDGEVYPGEQAAVVEQDLFDRVQKALAAHRCVRRLERARKNIGLLTGKLFCGACGVGMIHTYTSKQLRRYRYYVCTSAQKKGVAACPTGSIPALDIENYVVAELVRESQLKATDPPWAELSTTDQAARLAGIVDRIDYHGGTGELEMHLTAD